MRLEPDGFFQLTYCTNIHPGDGWEEVFSNVKKYAPALKRRLSPSAPFGLGLRLSSSESEQLLTGERLGQFKSFLEEHGLYVALINGFPYGSFHKRVIKEDVFAPDWRTEERVSYTLRMIEILKSLLHEGLDGGISTLPLSYKPWIAEKDETVWADVTRNLVRITEALVRARHDGDSLIHLDLEPEPDGLIENSAEAVAFYSDWLLPVGGPLLANSLNVPIDEAKQYLLDHIRVCFDTCHFAVEYDDPYLAMERFSKAGIKIGRVQISSALKVALTGDSGRRVQLAEALKEFAESTYLHQVIEQREGGVMHHYPDLTDAIPRIEEPRAQEWRIHFHVPLFAEGFGVFGATQEYIRAVFRLLKDARFTRHLEIETYTWDVLPPQLKQDLLESIDREYRWVLKEFEGKNAV